MKIKSNVLKQIQSRFSKPEVYDKRIMHPVREWLTGLTIFACIVCAGSAFSIHTFMSFQDIRIAEGTSDVLTVRYNQVLAQNALSLYNQRKSNYQSLQAQIQSGIAPVFEIATTSSTTIATTTQTNDTATTSETSGASETEAQVQTVQMAL